MLDRSQGRDFSEALNYFKNAANKGNTKSNFIYGNYHWKNGKIEESIPFFKASANNGHPKSLYIYSHYLTKIAKLNDDDKTIHLFKKAVEKGDADSIFIYGCRLKDRYEIARYVKIAADCGIIMAKKSYAQKLRSGDGKEIINKQ